MSRKERGHLEEKSVRTNLDVFKIHSADRLYDYVSVPVSMAILGIF